MIYQSIFFVVFVTTVQGAKLPNYFTKCKKNDPNIGECLVQNANTGLSPFVKGDSALHLQSMHPLTVPRLNIDVNGRLYINLTDVSITGLEKCVFEKAKIDFEKRKFEFLFESPYANVKAHYIINGRILILPITGEGPLNVTFVHPRIEYSFEYDLQQKGKHEYMVLKNSRLVYTLLNRAYFQLDNLFNGDKALGVQMDKFLNENWKEVNDEVGLKLGEAIGEVITTVLGNFFTKIPFSEMFED